ncbi:MAG: alpha/beta hydrolase [Chloroflexota bacterium]
MFPTPDEIEQNPQDYTHIVFLPGTLCDAALFAPQLAKLNRQQCSVADLTQDDTIAGMARRVLDSAPPHFSLVGLSMGGIVAFEIMRQAPQRVLDVFLLDTTYLPMNDEKKRGYQRFVDMAARGDMGQVVDEMIAGGLVSEARRSDTTLVNTVRDMCLRVGADAFTRQAHAIMNRCDYTNVLQSWPYDVTLNVGENDPWCTVDMHQKMAALFPNPAHITVIKECGHLSTLEKPHVVNTNINSWLMLRYIRLIMRAENYHQETENL